MQRKPNLKQLAVLDWLRRWPSITLNERGRWSCSWAGEDARNHMLTTVYRLGMASENTGAERQEREGWGDFDFTPHCGPATFKVLLAAGWVESAGSRGSRAEYRLSGAGREALQRYCFRLKGFKPRRAGESFSRPIRASASLLRRYGGPERARRSMEFHERQAAQHLKVATRLRESLALYEDSPERRRDEWLERKERKRSS